MTPDEKFLLSLYKIAEQKGDLEIEIKIEAVARSLRMRPVATNTIVKALAQANLIQKRPEERIRLTPRGIQLAEELYQS